MTKTQDVSSLSDTEALQLENKTRIVTNLVNSLHRAKGQDTTASWSQLDGTWYNEALDGICIVAYNTKFLIGFGDVTIRTAALDVALSPKNLGQSDLFSTANVSQFLTRSANKITDDGYLGTLKCQKVELPNHYELFTSIVFAIPNVNVQDLK